MDTVTYPLPRLVIFVPSFPDILISYTGWLPISSFALEESPAVLLPVTFIFISSSACLLIALIAFVSKLSLTLLPVMLSALTPDLTMSLRSDFEKEATFLEMLITSVFLIEEAVLSLLSTSFTLVSSGLEVSTFLLSDHQRSHRQ